MERLDVPLSPPGHRHESRERRRSGPFSKSRPSGRSQSTGAFSDGRMHDEWHTTKDAHAHHYGPPRRRWQHRGPSPGVKWRKKYDENKKFMGRVLVIEIVSQTNCTKDKHKVLCWEISNSAHLQNLCYSKERRSAALRIFHVQNAPWAVAILSRALGMAKQEDSSELSFTRWMQYPYQRHSRSRQPMLGGKVWPSSFELERSISTLSFGFDYLKLYKVPDPVNLRETDPMGKVMELDCADEEADDSIWSWDVYSQRLGVYIQRQEQGSQNARGFTVSTSEDGYGRTTTYAKGEASVNGDESSSSTKVEESPEYCSLDNGNVIVIFDSSKSNSMADTLIPARSRLEENWRRLPFYLAYEEHSAESDAQMAASCARGIVKEVFQALDDNWERFLNKAKDHVEILEKKVYDRPADESRADEIWRDQSHYLRIQRLASMHETTAESVNKYWAEISDDGRGPELALNVAQRVTLDLIQPTTNFADLLYKSVGIRDTRHSLELSYSMWRLSWITFIFLPLTFTVGFFGMNVDAFQNDPSISWFFISATPLMAVVLVSWFVLKWALTESRHDPYSRSVYDRLFRDMSSQYPTMWTRLGPIKDPMKEWSRWDRFRWALVQRWNQPNNTIRPIDMKGSAAVAEDRFDGLGAISRTQRILSRQWTEQIYAATANRVEIEKGGPRIDPQYAVRSGVQNFQESIAATFPATANQPDVAPFGWKLPNGKGVHHGFPPYGGGGDPLLSQLRPGYIPSPFVGAESVLNGSKIVNGVKRKEYAKHSPATQGNGEIVVPIPPPPNKEQSDGVAAAPGREISPLDLNPRIQNLRHIEDTSRSSDRRLSTDTTSRGSAVLVDEHGESDWNDEFAIDSGDERERGRSRPRQNSTGEVDEAVQTDAVGGNTSTKDAGTGNNGLINDSA